MVQGRSQSAVPPVRRAARGSLRDIGAARAAGERVQAAAATRAFLYFSAAVSLGYAAFFAVVDRDALTVPIVVNSGSFAVYAMALLVLRWGPRLLASLIAVGLPVIQILVCTGYFGWGSGMHLFLIALGPLVFIVLTDAEAVYRWLFLGIAAVTFMFCQFLTDPTTASYLFSDHLQSVLFSLNAAGTGLVTSAVAAATHFRSTDAQFTVVATAARALQVANTDALTGLPNRRPLQEMLAHLAGSSGGDYCLAIADIDHFKELNDTYGHQCGDVVLATVAHTMRAHLRGDDVVGRWGGEEFLFALPHTPLLEAVALMERMRRLVRAQEVPCAGHTHRVTASFGVAKAGADVSPTQVVRRADEAMYEAKQAGRDAVRSRSADPATEVAGTP